MSMLIYVDNVQMKCDLEYWGLCSSYASVPEIQCQLEN